MMKSKKTNPSEKGEDKNPFLLIISAVLISVAIILSGMLIKTTHVTNLPIEENGGLAVNIQDQTTRPFSLKVNQIINSSYTLASVPVINTYDLNFTTVGTLVVGDKIALLEQNGFPQILQGKILAINGNVITLDRPVPYNFTPSATIVFSFNNQINVDGSAVTQVFGISNFFNEPVDITRFIFHCRDATSMDDGTFCGRPVLTRGVVLRKELLDGNYINYFNVKNNGGWGELAYDKSYDDKAPAGLFGFTTRLTYGGQSKHGVVIRLQPNETIEFLIQDDLTGLSSGILMVEGHFIQN